MEQAIQPRATETLSARLDALAELLGSDAESVATGASEILDSFPGQAQALLLLTSALKLLGAEEGALEILEGLAQEHPNLASIQYELGDLLARRGMHRQAIAHLSRATELEPANGAAWRALGTQLALIGDTTAAWKAHARHLNLSLRELKLLEDAAAACRADEYAQAEKMMQQALAINPTDVLVTRLLGDLYLRLGRLTAAEPTLRRALKLAPQCATTRESYCLALTQRADWRAANAQLSILLEHDPDNVRLQALMAANFGMLGERDEAVDLFERIRPELANDSRFWLNYGQAARVLGKHDDEKIINAYRKCLALDPTYGAAWWGLADLKTYRFSASEIEMMRDQLKRDDIPDGLRSHIEFALGRGLEDRGAWAESFEHYVKANALRRAYVSYNADDLHNNVEALKAFFTPELFAARKNAGCPVADPIFIVGLPRAGSTLVEQILSSHSLVEGTMELPDIRNIVGEMIRKYRQKAFPNFLAEFDDTTLCRIGEEYLARTRYQRKLGRPFFTDKTGNNFLYIGFIQLVLPNAKIIDARRHPLSCGFSCFKQAFAPGALLFSYDQTDIARYYRDYVETTAHFDRVLPGRVYRVIHEELLRDPEVQIRRLLAWCDLPFEEQCLRFYETDRSVRTASSQQVRRPIQRKPVEAWQPYEAWLQPLKDALGDVLTRYPEVPEFGGAG
jgi:tetratricopeptide (TPR) repeat protein